jgi:phosphatidylserine decarboxylase
MRTGLSKAVGWLSDRRVPTALRPLAYRTYARLTGADLDEAVGPLQIYPSVAAFFVRRLKPGARPWPADASLLPSPADGRLQALDRITGDSLLQAKGQAYPASELLGGLATPEQLEGAWAWTIYLSPRDYHRVHAPCTAELRDLRWLGHARWSVAPKVVERRPRLYLENERVALELVVGEQRLWVVLVGAVNVGRLRVVGVPTGGPASARRDPVFERGDELGRFEMGSTVVMIASRDLAEPAADLTLGQPLRLGQPLGRWLAR